MIWIEILIIADKINGKILIVAYLWHPFKNLIPGNNYEFGGYLIIYYVLHSTCKLP